MTAKQYLQQAFQMKKKIAAIQVDILRLEAAATDCSPNLTGMPHNPSPSHSRMADIVCKIIDRKAELEKKVAELELIAAEIKYKISLLESNDHRTLLYKRYVEGAEWQDIAMDMFYSGSHIYVIHRAALAEMQKIIDGDTNR